ncbi:MAG: ABC transporter ATP-binding protein, partial [Bacteroidia bacterium]
MKVLDVHNFSVKFKLKNNDYVEVVKSINFKINQGEILGLIGESGSGKSVTSQAITQLIDGAIATGEVVFRHEESSINLLSSTPTELRDIRKKHISYIFQEPMTALNPLIPCGKQILESSDDKSTEHLNGLLEKVELYDHQRVSDSYPHELSGGQRQRIMIAMALAKNPTLLIADEPTTALDIAVQTEILLLLKKLCKSTSLSILFITHDLLSLEGFADKIAVMYHGEIVEFDDSSKILEQPSHPYSKALIESRATYDKRGKVLAEIDDLLDVTDGQLSYVDKPTTILSKQE